MEEFGISVLSLNRSFIVLMSQVKLLQIETHIAPVEVVVSICVIIINGFLILGEC